MRAMNLLFSPGLSVGLGALLLGVAGAQLQAASPERAGPLVGKAAPTFRVQGIFGEPYSLETFKGHILVMQFGASW
jgi:cytochrome c biogenesis protein CcmG/thiol:disulfide interchange protein DsbE